MLMKDKNRKGVLLILIIFIMTVYMLSIKAVGEENDPSPKDALQRIYDIRCEAFLTGNVSEMKKHYDISQKKGIGALEHEIKRTRYFNKWCQDRGMKLTDLKSEIRIKKQTVKENKVFLLLEETYKFDYVYAKDTQEAVNTFGIGIRHGVNLIKRDGQWIIYDDWYTDCFEDALRGFTVGSDINAAAKIKSGIRAYYDMLKNKRYTAGLGKYDRIRAVQYADKYCGAAYGSGNNYEYNPIYYDFNGAGGDCTNFVSQVLGDKKEGGGIPFDKKWFCSYPDYGKALGSTAWTNADGLKNYLLYTGRGKLIKRGTFNELSPSGKDYMQGAAGLLEAGDLVCYEKKGHIDHFAVVTSRDSKGYPLVNSHTADRHHVPWDLGWGDEGIRFYFIHIAY